MLLAATSMEIDSQDSTAWVDKAAAPVSSIAIQPAAPASPNAVLTQGYAGNGETGFGGAVGTGSLSLTNDSTNLYFAFTRGSGTFDSALVFYFDTDPGGATQLLTSGDRGTPFGGERAVRNEFGSGITAFPSGFSANYAHALRANDFSSVYSISGSNTNPAFVSNVSVTGFTSTTSATYTWSIPLSTLGLADGDTFTFVTTYLYPYDGGGSDASNRSNEQFGANDFGSSNPGFGDVTFTTALSYTLVPEPSTWLAAALTIGAIAYTALSRRIHAVPRK
jgi:hypothetical protein